MSMVVRTNTMAIGANNALNKNNSTVAGNLQKLSSGFRINRAADDASGLAVSEKMKAQIKALDTASKNAQDGASLIKTAEGYMGEIHDMLNRIVELAEKSANGTYEVGGTTKDADDNDVANTAATEAYGNAGVDRQAIQDEVDQLTTEIDRIAKTANFNGLKLLDGSLKQQKTDATPGTDLVPGAPAEYGKVNIKTEEQWNAALAASKSGKLYSDAAGANEATKPDTFDSENGTDFYSMTKAATADTPATPGTPASYSGGLKLQIGETSADSDKLTVSIDNFSTDSLFSALKNESANGMNVAVANESAAAGTAGITNAFTINVSNQDVASLAAEKVRDVINKVSAQRATLGAMENRLDYTMNNLDTASQNITDANSRIRDTDMAKTMMEYTQGNTLTQAAQAMLAQANQAPSQVLQLLQ